MKIMIMSDSHFLPRNDIIDLMRSQDVEYYIHCGDIYMNYEPLPFSNLFIVLGNNDYHEGQREIHTNIDGLNFFIVHGNRLDVNFTTELLVEKAKSTNSDIVCFGHTHKAYFAWEDGILLINPGSLSFPRGAYRHPTFCIFDTQTKDCIFYDVTTLQPCDPFGSGNGEGIFKSIKSIFK